jgi:hypothetical protein
MRGERSDAGCAEASCEFFDSRAAVGENEPPLAAVQTRKQNSRAGHRPNVVSRDLALRRAAARTNDATSASLGQPSQQILWVSHSGRQPDALKAPSCEALDPR